MMKLFSPSALWSNAGLVGSRVYVIFVIFLFFHAGLSGLIVYYQHLHFLGTNVTFCNGGWKGSSKLHCILSLTFLS